LRDEGFEVGRTHVRTLMRRMGVEVNCPGFTGGSLV
jgi:hypothetical protein